MNTFSQLLQTGLGISVAPRDLPFMQVSIRGVTVFIAALIMVRLSSKRSLAEKTAFDAVLVVIIGSMLARVINGIRGFFFDAGHWLCSGVTAPAFGIAAHYSPTFEILIKGEPAVLVQNGRLQRKNMFWEHISTHDLEEDLRLDAKTGDLSKIQVARLERSGDITFIKAR